MSFINFHKPIKNMRAIISMEKCLKSNNIINYNYFVVMVFRWIDMTKKTFNIIGFV